MLGIQGSNESRARRGRLRAWMSRALIPLQQPLRYVMAAAAIGVTLQVWAQDGRTTSPPRRPPAGTAPVRAQPSAAARVISEVGRALGLEAPAATPAESAGADDQTAGGSASGQANSARPQTAGSADKDELPPTLFSRQRRFLMPFMIDSPPPEEPQPVEVQLYFSVDEGKSWKLHSTREPTRSTFEFIAPKDGEFWFMLRTRDSTGRLLPLVPPGADLRVIVDSEPPAFEILAERGPAGNITVQWRVQEEHLDPRSLRLEYKSASQPDAAWETIAVSPARSSDPSAGLYQGKLSWYPALVEGPYIVRAEIADQAGNLRAVAGPVASSGDKPAGPLKPIQPGGDPIDSPDNSETEPAAEELPDTSLDNSARRQPRTAPATRNAAARRGQQPSGASGGPAASMPPGDGRQPPANPQQRWPARQSPPDMPSDGWGNRGGPLAPQGQIPRWLGNRTGPSGSTPDSGPGPYTQSPQSQAPLTSAPGQSGFGQSNANGGYASPTQDRAGPGAGFTQGGFGNPRYPDDRGDAGFSQPPADRWNNRADELPAPEELPLPDGDSTDGGRTPILIPGGQDHRNLPGGVRPRIVNSRGFEIDYQVDSDSVWGVAKVELWGTTDQGETWENFGPDPDNRSPYFAVVPAEGLYGFRIEAQNVGTQDVTQPASGADPQYWVLVDLTQPMAEFVDVQPSPPEIPERQVRITWNAFDHHLAERPVRLLFGASVAGPWVQIANRLENNGEFIWSVDRQGEQRVPDRVFLRLIVTDEAGNETVVDTPNMVRIRLSRPQSQIRDVRPLGTNANPSDR